jgi:hypothetical protein
MSEDKNLDITPELYNDETIIFLDLVVPVERIGCRISAADLLDKWHRLEAGGFPLKAISSLFYFLDRSMLEIPDEKLPVIHEIYIPGHLRHLVNLIDLVNRIKPIVGAQKRILSLQEELNSLVNTAYSDISTQNKMAREISMKILSAYDEFLIGSLLYEINPSTIFNESKGPDFHIRDKKVKVEVKSKQNRKFKGDRIDFQDLDRKLLLVDENICLNLLSKDAFEAARIEEAFDKQKADIAIFNTSHSQYGILFSAYAKLKNNPNFEFVRVIESCIENASAKTIIMFCEAISGDSPFTTYAMAEKKETVVDLGSRLDKIEKDKKIDTCNFEGFKSLIAEARALK